MKYYLDTNTIIYSVKGSYSALADHFRKVPPQSIVIPTIVMAEIEYGAKKSRNYDETMAVYRRFTNVFEKVSFSEEASIVYGEIRSFLEKKGLVIGPNDLIIASTVIADKGILVTHNTKEFDRIPELNVTDWTK